MKKRSLQERALKRPEVNTEYDVIQAKQELHELEQIARVRSAMSVFYGGIDPRRQQEIADGGMIQEDNNAMANLSPVAIHKEYPRGGFYSSPFIDDSTLG